MAFKRLAVYRAKRDFTKTSERDGDASGVRAIAIRNPGARRDDLRLEQDGVLSLGGEQGPIPQCVRRLAVEWRTTRSTMMTPKGRCRRANTNAVPAKSATCGRGKARYGSEKLPRALRRILACRKGGRVSIPGVCGGMADKFPLGALMEKGLTIRSGRRHVQKYLLRLLKMIAGKQIDTTPSSAATRRPTDTALAAPGRISLHF